MVSSDSAHHPATPQQAAHAPVHPINGNASSVATAGPRFNAMPRPAQPAEAAVADPFAALTADATSNTPPIEPQPEPAPQSEPEPILDPFAMLTQPSLDVLPDPFAPLYAPRPSQAFSANSAADPFALLDPSLHPISNGNGHMSVEAIPVDDSHLWRTEIDDEDVMWLPEPEEPWREKRGPGRPRGSLGGVGADLAGDVKPKLEAGAANDADGGTEVGQGKGKRKADDAALSAPYTGRKRGRPSKADLAARDGIEVKQEPKVPRKRGRPSKADIAARDAADGDDVDGGMEMDVEVLDMDVDLGTDSPEMEKGAEGAAVKEENGTRRQGQRHANRQTPLTTPAGRPRRQRKSIAKVQVDIRSDRSSDSPPSSRGSPPPSRSRSPTRSPSSVPDPMDPTPAPPAEIMDPNAPIAVLRPQGYGREVETPYNEHAVYTYFRYCAERHRMWGKRSQGVPRGEQTEDECMRNSFVGNIFRELDPGSVKARGMVVDQGDMSVEELCFRSFLFTGFYLESTYQALIDGLGEVPSWKSFNLEKYEAILHQHHPVNGNKIYYAGFQMVPPKLLFGREMPSYSSTLRLVKAMMEMGLPQRLSECRYAVDASEAIQTIPTFGGFLSLCLLCFIQEMSIGDELKFYLRNFASCGPGSRGYLQKIFGDSVFNNRAMELAGLTWLYENQWRYWARLGEDPPHAHELGLRPGMRVLDIENALCWCHKYLSNAGKYSSLADLPAPEFDAEADEAGPPAWCDEERYVSSASRPAYAGDYEEEKAKLAKLTAEELAALDVRLKGQVQGDSSALDGGVADANGTQGKGKGKGKQEATEEEEDFYECEKIINRLGDRAKRNGTFRVRWKGYTPEDDTWEPENDLKNGSEYVLSDWYEWENKVHATISRIKAKFPYRGPEWKDVGVKKGSGKNSKAGSKENSVVPGADAAGSRPQRAKRSAKGPERYAEAQQGKGKGKGKGKQRVAPVVTGEGVQLDNGDGAGEVVIIDKEEVDMELPQM